MDDVVSYVDTSECVIISDLLYYVGNKIGSTAVKNIVTAATNFYTDEEYVFNEKKKLCKATEEECKTRRTENKRQVNIEDIVAIFARRDSQKLFMPKFVSSDINKIPMNADGNPSLGQILAVISDLRRNTVTTEMLASSFANLKAELSLSSPSPSLLPFEPSDTTSTSTSRLTPTAPTEDSAIPIIPTVEINATSDGVSAPASSSSSAPLASGVAPAASGLLEEGMECGVDGGGEAWQQGGSRRKDRRVGGGGGGAGGVGEGSLIKRGGRNDLPPSMNNRFNNRSRDSSRPKTIIGKNVNNGLTSVKGADLTINKFVSRFHNDTSEEELRQFITDQDVDVIELEEIKTAHSRYKSFRLRIKRIDLIRVEDGEFWPQGVILCPYYRPRNQGKRLGVIGATAANGQTNNV